MAKIIVNPFATPIRVEKGFLYWAWEETLNVVSDQQGFLWADTVGFAGELDLSDLERDTFNQVVLVLLNIAHRELMTSLYARLCQRCQADPRYRSEYFAPTEQKRLI